MVISIPVISRHQLLASSGLYIFIFGYTGRFLLPRCDSNSEGAEATTAGLRMSIYDDLKLIKKTTGL